MVQLLGLQGLWRYHVHREAGSNGWKRYGFNRDFSSLCSRHSKGCPVWSFFIVWPSRHLLDSPSWSFSIPQCNRHSKGSSSCSFCIDQLLMPPPGGGSTPFVWRSSNTLFLMATWFFSKGIPGADFLPPSPQLSPWHQQQSFLWDFSPIPILQLPAAMHTSGPTPQFRVCRATALIVYVVLIPFRLSQISCSTLQHPQFFPSVPKDFPGCKNLSPDSALLLTGLVLLALLFVPSFFHPTQSPDLPPEKSVCRSRSNS